MADQGMAARELEVSRGFDVGQLCFCSERPECYTLVEASYVVIESKGNIPCTARFDRRKGQIVCDCPQARQPGGCDHQQALAGGLWARLATLPRHRSLVTCTQDWGEPPSSQMPSFSLSLLPQFAFADPIGG